MRAKLSNLQSIPQVVAEMTLDEKLDMVGCYRACHTRPIPDMDVPAIYLMDGATGLNGIHVVLDYLTDPCRADDPRTAYATPEMVALNRIDLNEAAEKYKGDALMTDLVEQAAKYRPGGRQHISFPSGINIGASFDPITAETIGHAVGQELRDVGVDVCFGPNVDIARDPLGGRNYEMYGEDPELVAQTAAAFVRGMQSAGIAACAKHFLANNQETNRNTTSSNLSKRVMMELYARGFEAAIEDGHVLCIMSAYNAVRPHTAQPQPAQPAAPQPAPQVDTVPQPDTAAPAPAVDEPTLMADSYHHTRDAVDDLVDTLTGRIRLTPVTPDAAAQPAQTQPFRQAPQAQPAHTGFTQDLGSYAAPAAPAHTGFTQNLGQAPVEPATGSFVDNIANAINTGAISDETTRYDEMAARLTSNLEEEAGESTAHTGLLDKFRLGGFHLGGKADDESADSAAQPFDTAEIPVSRRRDYESAEDAPAVRKELDENLLHLTTACIVSGAAALVLLVLAFIAAALPAMPGVLAGETVYPAVALVLLAVAAGINWKTLLNGLQGLAKKPTPDSLTALAVVGALLQALIVLVTKGYTNEVTLLAGPAALVLCVNTVGKRMNAATVRDNFQLVSKNVDHAVAYRLKDAGALRAASQGLAQPHPSVLVSRPTQIFRGFLASSAAAGTSDKNQQQFAWAAGGCALLGFLITVIRTHNLTSAVTILASILCLAAPLAGTLLAALPARLMQRSAAQVGAVVPGWRDIRQLGRINVIQVTARDLFPQGCVTLAGIKPIKNAPIDLAIVYAASIMAEACPTLRDVFLNMLGDRSMIAKVDDREAVYGKGYIGWVNKRRVLVGNRSLMQDYGVKLPSLEYEQHHTVNQRRMIYLAVSGKLFAMFQVAYQRDPDTAAVLDSLRHSGLSLIVDCDDFNCDTALLEAAYSLPAGAVKVLNTAEHELMNPATAWLPESDGNMLHLGSFASFVGGLEAAAGAAEGERKSAVVVTASVLISCVLGVLLTLTGGLATLPLPALVLYQAAWCVLAMIFPLFQRY